NAALAAGMSPFFSASTVATTVGRTAETSSTSLAEAPGAIATRVAGAAVAWPATVAPSALGVALEGLDVEALPQAATTAPSASAPARNVVRRNMVNVSCVLLRGEERRGAAAAQDAVLQPAAHDDRDPGEQQRELRDRGLPGGEHAERLDLRKGVAGGGGEV